MGKKETEFKVTIDWPGALEHLRTLLASLEAGGVRVSQGERTLELSTRGSNQVNLEIQAKDKGDKCKLSLELAWSRSAHAEGDLSLAPLKQASAPAPVDPAAPAPVEPAAPAPAKTKAPARKAAAKPKPKAKPKAARTKAASAGPRKNTRKAAAAKRTAK
jgi:amphi-Trp domain-containing protein